MLLLVVASAGLVQEDDNDDDENKTCEKVGNFVDVVMISKSGICGSSTVTGEKEQLDDGAASVVAVVVDTISSVSFAIVAVASDEVASDFDNDEMQSGTALTEGPWNAFFF